MSPHKFCYFFCDDQPVPEERLEQRKKHFQEMDEDKFFGFHTALEGEKDHTMRKLTANQWQVKFDNILDGRNGTIHFRNWDSLRAAVVEIRGMLLRHPKIGDNLKDEVWVIQEFEFFRKNALKTDGVAKVGKRPVK